MISRSAVSILILAGVLCVGAAAAGSPAPVGQSIFVVRPDPRACPSPLCGGYWVTRANHARTRCHDDLLRPRCYVSEALDEDRQALTAGIPDGALVRGVLEPGENGPFGELGLLLIGEVRAPVGKGVKGTYFRVRDLGIRCVRAPCFHLRTTPLNRAVRRTVSSLDLVSIAQPTVAERRRAEAALSSPNGLWLLGIVIESSDGGRVLQASRFYLASKS